jgi:hypothetical protein
VNIFDSEEKIDEFLNDISRNSDIPVIDWKNERDVFQS